MTNQQNDVWSGLLSLLGVAKERVDDPAITGGSVTFERRDGIINVVASLTVKDPTQGEQP
jgi:hypothetical protein